MDLEESHRLLDQVRSLGVNLELFVAAAHRYDKGSVVSDDANFTTIVALLSADFCERVLGVEPTSDQRDHREEAFGIT